MSDPWADKRIVFKTAKAWFERNGQPNYVDLVLDAETVLTDADALLAVVRATEPLWWNTFRGDKMDGPFAFGQGGPLARKLEDAVAALPEHLR